MRLAIFLCLAGLTACASATLPPRGTLAMRDVQFPVRDLRYASGLRILVEEDHRRPVVAVVALVGSGGASDPKGKEGLAHLVEHLTLRAHAEQQPNRWVQLEAAGAGRVNAATSFDTTVYHAMAPRRALGELLRIEGERLTVPLQGITPEIFDVEREVVRNELRERTETGYVGQVFSAVQKACFPEDHPYARPIAGEHPSLSALTLADARAFTRSHYRPENTTLVIVGDVDASTVDQLIAQHLPASLMGAGLMDLTPDKRLPDEPPTVPLNPRTRVLEVEASVPAPELYLGWTLPRGYDDASFLQTFVERTAPFALGRARAEDGDIADVDTLLIPGRLASLFLVRVVLHNGDHPEQSAQRVLGQIYRLWADQLEAGDVLASRTEMQRQRLSVITGMAFEAEDIMARALSRAELTHFSLDARAYSRSLAAVARADSSRITRFAYDYLQKERARVVVVRPPRGSVGQAVAGGRTAPVSIDEDVLGQVLLTPPPSVSGFRTLRLENGLEVVLGSVPGMPLATVRVWMHGGSAMGEPLGVSTLAEALVFPGSRLQGSASDFGLRPRDSVSSDHVTFGFSGVAGNLPNMLAMTAEQLSSLKTEDAYVLSFREEFLPYLAKAEARPEARADRAFQAALYPQHPYGRTALAADLREVDKGDIDKWVERTYRPANAVVAVVGELDLEETEKQVRTWLSQWKGAQGAPELPPAPEPGPARPVRFLRTASPGATQTGLVWGCPLPAGEAAAEVRYELMAELASTRLSRQVRASLGASYGMYGLGVVREGGAAHLEVGGVVENAQLAPALTAVRQTLEELSLGKWRPVELEAARRRVNQERALSLGTTSALAQAVLAARGRGWPLSEVENYPKHLVAITPEELQRDFTWCAQHLVVSLWGEEAVMRDAEQVWSRETSEPHD